MPKACRGILRHVCLLRTALPPSPSTRRDAQQPDPPGPGAKRVDLQRLRFSGRTIIAAAMAMLLFIMKEAVPLDVPPFKSLAVCRRLPRVVGLGWTSPARPSCRALSRTEGMKALRFPEELPAAGMRSSSAWCPRPSRAVLVTRPTTACSRPAHDLVDLQGTTGPSCTLHRCRWSGDVEGDPAFPAH
jgi:hypothetical protein